MAGANRRGSARTRARFSRRTCDAPRSGPVESVSSVTNRCAEKLFEARHLPRKVTLYTDRARLRSLHMRTEIRGLITQVASSNLAPATTRFFSQRLVPHSMCGHPNGPSGEPGRHGFGPPEHEAAAAPRLVLQTPRIGRKLGISEWFIVEQRPIDGFAQLAADGPGVRDRARLTHWKRTVRGAASPPHGLGTCDPLLRSSSGSFGSVEPLDQADQSTADLTTMVTERFDDSSLRCSRRSSR
jgi:hypothetical protein